MTKGIVFLFEAPHMSWFCEKVTNTTTGIRGFVRDGFWWMDYNSTTQVVKVCIMSHGEVHWDRPIAVHKNKLIKMITVPSSVEGSPPEMVEWALSQG